MVMVTIKYHNNQINTDHKIDIDIKDNNHNRDNDINTSVNDESNNKNAYDCKSTSSVFICMKRE